MKSLLTPHITEKSYQKTEKGHNTYTFKVASDLSKGLIKKKIEQEHKVTVESVNIVNLPGKTRRFKGIVGKTSPIKKALVRLKKGDSIAAFQITESKENSETTKK